jgi:competence protein ComEA
MNEVLERYRVHIIWALLLLLLLAGAAIYLRRPMPQPIQIIEPSPSPIPTPAQLAVYVTGAVVNPGVYYLPEGSRVEEALQEAGGPTAEADLNRVNLAQRVHDEEQIYVPEVGEESPLVPLGSPSEGGPININTASVAELEALPGIGPTLAQCVVDYREAQGPFAAIEDIMNVQGIGEGLFNEIRDLITVG